MTIIICQYSVYARHAIATLTPEKLMTTSKNFTSSILTPVFYDDFLDGNNGPIN